MAEFRSRFEVESRGNSCKQAIALKTTFGGLEGAVSDIGVSTHLRPDPRTGSIVPARVFLSVKCGPSTVVTLFVAVFSRKR